MFPLSLMLTSFVQSGSLTVIDANGKRHKFAGKPALPAGGAAPDVTMELKDRELYRRLFFNPELHAGEAYMDGRMTFPGSSLRDFLTLFSLNRQSLAQYPLQAVLKRASRGLKRFQQADRKSVV